MSRLHDFYPFPTDKFLDWSDSKAFGKDQLNFTQNIKSLYNTFENILDTSISSFCFNDFNSLLVQSG